MSTIAKMYAKHDEQLFHTPKNHLRALNIPLAVASLDLSVPLCADKPFPFGLGSIKIAVGCEEIPGGIQPTSGHVFSEL